MKSKPGAATLPRNPGTRIGRVIERREPRAESEARTLASRPVEGRAVAGETTALLECVVVPVPSASSAPADPGAQMQPAAHAAAPISEVSPAPETSVNSCPSGEAMAAQLEVRKNLIQVVKQVCHAQSGRLAALGVAADKAPSRRVESQTQQAPIRWSELVATTVKTSERRLRRDSEDSRYHAGAATVMVLAVVAVLAWIAITIRQDHRDSRRGQLIALCAAGSLPPPDSSKPPEIAAATTAEPVVDASHQVTSAMIESVAPSLQLPPSPPPGLSAVSMEQVTGMREVLGAVLGRPSGQTSDLEVTATDNGNPEEVCNALLLLLPELTATEQFEFAAQVLRRVNPNFPEKVRTLLKTAPQPHRGALLALLAVSAEESVLEWLAPQAADSTGKISMEVCETLAQIARRDLAAFRKLAWSIVDVDKPALRRAMLYTLSRCEQPEAVDFIVMSFSDSDAAIRAEALSALLRLGLQGRTVPPALREMLQSPDVSLRLLAVRATGEFKDLPSVPLLIAMLEDADSGIAAQAHHALQAATGKEFSPETAVWRQWWTVEGQRIQPTIEQCLTQLLDAQWEQRVEALRALVPYAHFLRDAEITRLSALLTDPAPAVRVAACGVLAGVPIASARNALTAVCFDSDPVVQAAATAALQ